MPSLHLHACSQALKAQSLLYSVESVCSAASYDTGTNLGCQEHEQKGRRYLGCTGGGNLEQAGGLQVPDVVMSPPTFYSFEHFIKTSKPNHNFHLLDRAGIWLGLFLSVASRFFSFLGWAGREERGKGTSLLLPYLPLWCFYKATAGSTAQALRGGAAVLT